MSDDVVDREYVGTGARVHVCLEFSEHHSVNQVIRVPLMVFIVRQIDIYCHEKVRDEFQERTFPYLTNRHTMKVMKLNRILKTTASIARKKPCSCNLFGL